uniref:Uncharacterized protein n=1 Tax=Meloidogyne enterolobii TaxID=390850 RepID=A0A6V7U6W4_MELEN|nr:unnamed protein product [Meloidogyne enterolobii]
MRCFYKNPQFSFLSYKKSKKFLFSTFTPTRSTRHRAFYPHPKRIIITFTSYRPKTTKFVGIFTKRFFFLFFFNFFLFY